MKPLLLLTLFCFSAQELMAQTTDASPYCKPLFKEAATTTDRINSVNVTPGGFSNSSALYNNSNYVFYNNLPTITFTAGQMYTVTVYGIQTTTATTAAVFIDLDHDNYLDITGEMLASSPNLTNSSWGTGIDITIPLTADTGMTRMRIVGYGYDAGVSMASCPNGLPSSFSPQRGEVEDYNVRILPPTTGINNLTSKTIGVYPHPVVAEATISIHTSENLKGARLIIKDLTGRTIKEMPMEQSTLSFSRAGMTAGLYTCHVYNGGSCIGSGRIMIQ